MMGVKKLFKASVMIAAGCMTYNVMAQTSVSSITSDMNTHLATIWGVAKWVMQAILVLVAAVMAFKTATGGGQDKTGGWITVIGAILLAIGLNAVPAIASAIFPGINLGGN
jgi:hypothetical protein